ncbi:MAG: hypothetical protein US51_C0030G0008 [Microgenomates group bacterium GW2011_GWA2_37_6]|nr:MAG: hypothetical protein US51_C0030G0008 [Microgenomates group bacterium GW2011_GWA2_37_6]
MLEMFNAARTLTENQTTERLVAINSAEQALKDSGVVDPGPAHPTVLPSQSADFLTPQALEAEIERQAIMYQERGFPRELGYSSNIFKDIIMRLVAPQEESSRGRFDTPIIVIGSRIPVGDQYELLGVDYSLGEQMRNWDALGYETPTDPRLVWMQDGSVNLGKDVKSVKNSLSTDERGANIYDGVGLLVARPTVLHDYIVDLPGSLYGHQFASPTLRLWGLRPSVSYEFVGFSDPSSGSATCARA